MSNRLLGGPTYDMGEFYFSEGLVKPFEFRFSDLKDYHYTNPVCFCTDITSVDVNSGVIKGNVNIGSAIGDLKKTVGEHRIEKSIFVKFDPNKHEFVADEIGKRKYNSEVEILHLTIKFLVRVLDPQVA